MNKPTVEIDEPVVIPWGFFTRRVTELIFVTRKHQEITIAFFPSEEWTQKALDSFNRQIDQF